MIPLCPHCQAKAVYRKLLVHGWATETFDAYGHTLKVDSSEVKNTNPHTLFCLGCDRMRLDLDIIEGRVVAAERKGGDEV